MPCRHCRKRAFAGTKFCAFHLLAGRLAKRKALGSKVWKPGRRGRPPVVPDNVLRDAVLAGL